MCLLLLWLSFIVSFAVVSQPHIPNHREEKEIDFAEQLESVAYVLCGEGTITFEKFISIWNARGVSVLAILTMNIFEHWTKHKGWFDLIWLADIMMNDL